MLKNFKVTTKLVAILVAPVVVLLLLATIGVRQRLSDASEANRVQELTTFVGKAGALLKEVESESVWASVYSGSARQQGKAQFEAQQNKTDEAIQAFKTENGTIDPGRGSEPIKAAITQIESRVNQLRTQRVTAINAYADGRSIAEFYGNFADEIVLLVEQVANVVDDPAAARGLASYTRLLHVSVADANTAQRAALPIAVGYFPARLPKASEQASRLDQLESGCGNDASTPVAAPGSPAECKAYTDLVDAQATGNEVAKTFQEGATPNQKVAYRSGAEEVAFVEMVNDAIAGGKAGSGGAPGNDLQALKEKGDAFPTAAISRISRLDNVGNNLLLDEANPESVFSVASAAASRAQQQATLYFFGALVSIMLAALITYSVGRSITGPLRKLTNAAYTLSTERLPALVERLRNPEDESHESLAASLTPIDIHSKDEIGQLADSFNSIQQVTIEVAEEQSVLLRKGIGDIFINLARRNQTLLDRQIEFIDQLEANEEDPDQLDNLFKLDHLATRMRRNAESLLVLAGAEPPRRRGRPVALADVVRVAIGEVEDFARIQLLALDDATVGGNVAVDLAHLLSELMENATHFSPPDTMVEIVGHRAENGYIISVSDQGIGMSPEQIAESNHQLARPPLVGLALSRSLGFIVIGRLAQRFDISVKLTSSPSGGVTALVTLPAELVTYDGEELPTGKRELTQGPSTAAEDVMVIDEDLTIVDDYQPAPLLTEPEAPYEPVVEYEQLQDSGLSESDEFERGLHEMLRDDVAPTQDTAFAPPAPAPTPEPPAARPAPAPAPKAEPRPAPARERAAPIVTVAEQIAANSRAEAAVADMTAAGLVRRTPKKRATNAVGGGSPLQSTPRVTTSSSRSPEEVRKMLSRYRSGLNKGRTGADSESSDS